MEDPLLDEQEVSAELKLAGFWPRAGASVLDNIVFIPLILLQFYNIIHWKIYLLDVLIWMLVFAYKPFMEWHYQATIGKMINKLKVVDSGGGPIESGQAMIRYVFYAISYVVSLYANQLLFNTEGFAELTAFEAFPEFQEKAIAGILMYSQTATVLVMISILLIFFDERKQTLHDKMAGTFVVFREAEN